MINYKENYNKWLEDNFFDEETREELSNLIDEKEIEDRFYRDLEFGTGGLRGVMGAGTNRMNKYTIGKATKGLGTYLLDHYGVEVCAKKGVVIGYDTRNNSKDFSEITANVLTGMGIKVFLHSEARPTPQLSFSVKFLNALAGVVITASHNPKEYNGYKVYDEYGCQLVPWQAKQVIQYVNAIEDYHTISFEGNDSLLETVEVTDNFVSEVMRQSRYEDATAKADLKVVYTPLHGTGYEMIDFTDYQDLFNKYSTLNKISFDYAVVEKEQSIQVMRYAGEWKDVGSWNMMAEVMADKTKGNVTLDKTCENTQVINELDIPILCMGCKDMVVAASGDGILVSDKERSGQMKSYVEEISTDVHFAEKSWGTYTVIDVQPQSMTIKIKLKKGNHMKYHAHEHREEVWTIVSGYGKVVVDGREQEVKTGDVITLPVGCKHILIAETDMSVIEVQIGEEISPKDKIVYSL